MRAHGVTEGTEVTQCHASADGTKSDEGIAYRFLITTLLCFNNPPSSPFLRVTFRQKPNLKWQTLLLQNTEDPKK